MAIYVVDIAIEIPVFSLLGLVCLLSNAFVCYVIATKRIPNMIKYYIFSMALTDILTGAVCIPVYLWKEWILFHRKTSLRKQAELLISVLRVSESLLATSSVLHLCLIAFDRVMSISRPIYHRLKLKRKSAALKLLAISWLLAAVNSVLFTILVKSPTNWTIIVAITIILPGCFIISCYSILFCKIRKRNSSLSRESYGQRISETRLIKTLLVVVIAFVMSWIPVFSLSIYYTVNIRQLPNNISILTKLSTFFQYSNSACNPFIYALFNPVFRGHTNNVLRAARESTEVSSTSRIKASNAQVTNNTAFYVETTL